MKTEEMIWNLKLNELDLCLIFGKSWTKFVRG